jgi:hypothetical protein
MSRLFERIQDLEAERKLDWIKVPAQAKARAKARGKPRRKAA